MDLKRIFRCLNEDDVPHFFDSQNDIPGQPTGKELDKRLLTVDGLGGAGGGDEVGDEEWEDALPCAETPHGCGGCPGGNPEGCYVDENGNYYVSMLVEVCCGPDGQPFLQEMLVFMPWGGSGPRLGIYCTEDLGCQAHLLGVNGEGNLECSEIVWSGNGNLFYSTIQLCNAAGVCTTAWMTANCQTYDCLLYQSSWTIFGGQDIPHDHDSWDYYIWLGQQHEWVMNKYPDNPSLGIGRDSQGNFGFNFTFPFGGPDDQNAPYERWQSAWNTFVNWWRLNSIPPGQPPPQPWPEGWTPSEGWE